LQTDFIDGVSPNLSGDGAGKGTSCSNRETETPERERGRECIQRSTTEVAVKCDSRYPTSGKTESIVVTNATLYLEYSNLEFLAVSQLSRAFHSVRNPFSLLRACLYLVQ
jgi:hypothetical protein